MLDPQIEDSVKNWILDLGMCVADGPKLWTNTSEGTFLGLSGNSFAATTSAWNHLTKSWYLSDQEVQPAAPYQLFQIKYQDFSRLLRANMACLKGAGWSNEKINEIGEYGVRIIQK